MARLRRGDPWMPADEYGRSLPGFTINLLVSDVSRSARFYREVLGAEERYSDPDFCALRLGGTDFMLHADHAYEVHPWHGALIGGQRRGLGAEMRLLGRDPDDAEQRAAAGGGSVLAPATDKAHGWREAWLEDPDGYVWAIGVPIGGER